MFTRRFTASPAGTTLTAATTTRGPHPGSRFSCRMGMIHGRLSRKRL